MVERRELSSEQRKAKNERDRKRRHEIKEEFERLKSLEAVNEELKARVIRQRNFISQLEENTRLRDMVHMEPYLTINIHEIDNTFGQQIEAMLLSSNGKEPIDQDTESSHTNTGYTDEFVQDFIKRLDDKEKSRVDFPDFRGLTEEMERSGRFSFPPSLVPIDEILKETYGDITAESKQSIPLIRDSYILFCSVIKEMTELQLEQVDLDKMILWRDAINSGLSIGFKGNFAIEHLKKIARAYFGSKGRYDQGLKIFEERILELRIQLYTLEKKHNSIVEKHQECLKDQEYFEGKPLSSGLFISLSL